MVNNNISVGFIKISWSGLTVHYILIKQCHICFTTNCKRPCFDWHAGDHRHGNNVSELISELGAKRPAHLEMIKKHKNRLQAPLPRWLWLEESWKSLSDYGYIKTMKKKRKEKNRRKVCILKGLMICSKPMGLPVAITQLTAFFVLTECSQFRAVRARMTPIQRHFSGRGFISSELLFFSTIMNPYHSPSPDTLLVPWLAII